MVGVTEFIVTGVFVIGVLACLIIYCYFYGGGASRYTVDLLIPN